MDTRYHHGRFGPEFVVVLVISVIVTLLAFATGAILAQDCDITADLPVDKPVVSAAKDREKKRETPPPPPPPQLNLLPPPDPWPELYGRPLMPPDRKTRSVIFVLDISGSMSLDPGPFLDEDQQARIGDRLARAKAALNSSIRQLTPAWKFNVLAYDHSTLFLRAGEMAIATEGVKVGAAAWVNCRTAFGATATGPAVAAALHLDRSNKLVVLVSDGAPNVGATDGSGDDACIARHRLMIREHNAQKSRIDTFGISASGAFRRFLLDVAGDSGGSYQDVR